MHNSVIDTVRTAQPKILVLGATGGTGRLIVSQAVAREYDVTMLTRSAEKASGLEGTKLIVGDARDEIVLRQALEGQDAVISALGTPASPLREVTLLSTATRALVGAMKAEQVSRLICITGIGAGETAGHGGFLFDNVIFPLLLRNVYADKNRQEAIVRESSLDWVLVRPSILNDKPGRDSIRGAHGSFRLPWWNHIARKRRKVCSGPTACRCLAASFSVDHMVKATSVHRSRQRSVMAE